VSISKMSKKLRISSLYFLYYWPTRQPTKGIRKLPNYTCINLCKACFTFSYLAILSNCSIWLSLGKHSMWQLLEMGNHRNLKSKSL
jgi:hypothetical protein